MPEKYLGLWGVLWDSLPEPMRAGVVGAVVAFLRVMYDNDEPSIGKRLLECALSGSIALGITSLCKAFGVAGEIGVAVGSAVGLLGVDTVRAWAKRIGEQRVRDLES
ncbi:putative protein of the phage holin family (Lysis protein S) [Aromatoleum aromaticum EbN1]|uniref:Phage holin, lambda family n=1 Tax=Aromatoleum aromaticum (strain DSM 19018 / LMG 30748 / EbN1) TaxID=76114 RepID=Q5NXH2_AROAE|nr:phage holin, lambda family [Aromatoleum aromaticum]CAI10242.1 putative protein of the phage holin family (Lysis protein S) [Aromatoleum aromaticum EbN1]